MKKIIIGLILLGILMSGCVTDEPEVAKEIEEQIEEMNLSIEEKEENELFNKYNENFECVLINESEYIIYNSGGCEYIICNSAECKYLICNSTTTEKSVNVIIS